MPEDQRSSRFYSFTLAQVNYKLGRYGEAIDLFSGANSELFGDIGEQADDICTNLAACAANDEASAEKCLKIFDELHHVLESFEF